MAVGKNKRGPRKKGGKKKIVDAFAKKDWFTVMAPGPFKNRDCGMTPANRTAGTKNVVDNLRGRIVEASLGDLQRSEGLFYQQYSFRIEEVQGSECLTTFHGLKFTTDKVCSLIRKWQTLIEAHIDLKTTDGFFLRLFCIGFTHRRPNQLRKTSYAQSSQIKAIRKKMFDILTREASTCDMRDLIDKFIANSIGEKIEKECHGIYPLQNVYIRKVKVLKAPKFDLFRFNESISRKKEEDTGKTI
mmetsp:Transcript_114677/g.160997  ORF Transcript_114677/g.160997 Transcript_114677/m.160997 type:complete len:244 (+) Transcript_114677:14-745(+)